MFPLLETVRHTFHSQTPSERLAKLQRDKQEARDGIHRVLDGLARRNSIPQGEIERAMDDFADALLEDATAEIEEEIALDLTPDDEEG